MSNSPKYPDLPSVLSSIRIYADEHKLTPDQVGDLFSTGIAAAHVLRPDLVEERTTPPNVEVCVERSEFAGLKGYATNGGRDGKQT